MSVLISIDETVQDNKWWKELLSVFAKVEKSLKSIAGWMRLMLGN